MIVNDDCVAAMNSMEPESVDAVVTDPPYGLEFMGKEWDRLGGTHRPEWLDGVPTGWCECGKPYPHGRAGDWNDDQGRGEHARTTGRPSGRRGWDGMGPRPRYHTEGMQTWHQQWAEAAYRVAKPSAYLLAFGGTRTVHRLTCALEDAGWIIRDLLVWGYASGFPKSKASLKPAWEPIVMARKPGPLRELAIDACRIPTDGRPHIESKSEPSLNAYGDGLNGSRNLGETTLGRWPANIVLTDPIFDGGWEGVVGGGAAASGGNINGRPVTWYGGHWADSREFTGYQDEGTYSRFFLIPKADRADREPVLGGLSGLEARQQQASIHADPDAAWAHKNPNHPRRNGHPTVKPVDLMRHLVRLVTPTGGTVLDPFLGSGTTAIAAEMEGFAWIGIEREAEYVAIAEARLNGTQRGLGLDVDAPTHQPAETAEAPSEDGASSDGDLTSPTRRRNEVDDTAPHRAVNLVYCVCGLRLHGHLEAI